MATERDCFDCLLDFTCYPELSLPETLALGILVAGKWDRAGATRGIAGRATAEQALAFDNFTLAKCKSSVRPPSEA
jgi:hypothetical protein